MPFWLAVPPATYTVPLAHGVKQAPACASKAESAEAPSEPPPHAASVPPSMTAIKLWMIVLFNWISLFYCIWL